MEDKKIATDYWLKKISHFEEVKQNFNQDSNVLAGRYSMTEVATNLEVINDMAGHNSIAEYTIYLSVFNTLIKKESQNENVWMFSPNIKLEGSEDILEDSLLLYDFKFHKGNTLKEVLNITKSEIETTLPYAGVDFNVIKQGFEENKVREEDYMQFGFSYDQVNPDSELLKQVSLCLSLQKDADGNLLLEVSYDKQQYSDLYIRNFVNHYLAILHDLKNFLPQELSNISVLSSEEKETLFKFSGKLESLDETSVIAIFHEQVNKTPDKVALVHNDKSFTYAELNQCANQLGQVLRENHQVKTGDFVGLMVDYSEHTIISFLAILKLGAAYVPLDPSLPAERLDYILTDTTPKALVIHSDYLDQVILYDIPVFNIDLELEEDFTDTTNVIPETKGELAYVMYTSGSTGIPKGVLIENKGIVRLVKETNFIQIQAEDNLLAISNPAFDGSTFDIWGALLNGATLNIPEKGSVLNFETLSETIEKRKINVAFMTTALFNSIVDNNIACLSNLRKILFGGEMVSVRHVEAFINKFGKGRLLHVYGPTENTTYSTFFPVDEVPQGIHTIPIGQPITNTQCYILNEKLKLQPIGVQGELYVGGAGLAKGYLNKPDLSADRFIKNPFVENALLYKTGDFCKWLPCGEMEFIGRIDDQIKIRGFRVELGEIETRITAYQGINEAIVVVRTDKNNVKFLSGFFTGETKVSTDDLRANLKEGFPEYMVPTNLTQVETMPLNRNGKVDKKKLLLLEKSTVDKKRKLILPTTDLQKKLHLFWQDLLDRPSICITDDFFDIGGHSLKATHLISQIHKEVGIKIEISSIFIYRTIEKLAEVIEKRQETSFVEISPLPEQAAYEVSSSQRRLWSLSQFDEAKVAYNIPGAYVFKGKLNEQALNSAFNALIERHESLRTVFKQDDRGVLKQHIKTVNALGFAIDCLDLRADADREVTVQRLLSEAGQILFDLPEGPLLDAKLFQIADDEWVFSCVMHHIISDGLSMEVFIKELLLFYDTYDKGLANNLSSLRIQYKDYTAWQNEQLEEAALVAHKTYWLEQFDGDLPVLGLLGDRVRPAIKTYNGGIVETFIDASLLKGLESLSQKQGGTLFMGLLSLVNTLLYRYTQDNDIVIGTQIAGREHADLESQIGLYTNVLPLRTRFKEASTFNDLLQAVKGITLNAFEHQIYPFDLLIDHLELKYDRSRNPLFDVTVVLQNADLNENIEQQRPGDLEINPYEGAESLVSRFDLSFNFIEVGEELQASIVYNSDIYKEGTVKQILNHLEQLLSAVINTPDLPIAEVDFLKPEEKQQVLTDFNSTASSYPKTKTIVDVFQEQVKINPDKIAVVFEDKGLTYEELDEQSNRLAQYLKTECNINTGDFVGVMLDKSDSLLISVLGILKSGGVYAPIDSDYPNDRKAFVIKDLNVKTLITQTDYVFDIDYFGGHLFAADVQLNELAPCQEMARTTLGPTDLAYVMYTSGSTGRPKGVLVEHRSVVRLVKSTNYIELTGKEILLSTGSISFDATTFEYWSVLLNGGTLILCNKDVLLDSDQLSELIKAEEVDTMWFTSGWLNQLVDQDIRLFSPLKTVLAGGDKLSPPHIQKLLERYPELQIINGYGPTENTTFSIAHPISLPIEGSIPLGKPISNSTAYILDKKHQLCPVGVAGEIYLGGHGLARGYLNRPELTEQKFIAHPYEANERLYKTGDLGCWTADGEIKFLGRQDDQVKIRGYRVEPGEVERVIENHPSVESAIVLAKSSGDEAEKLLVAYIIGVASFDETTLRSYLNEKLPVYMVPVHYVVLAEFPLTANGKVDRRALPEPDGSGRKVAYIAPRNDTEKQLALIWQEILRVEEISIKDDFFTLGGHSLRATRLANQIQKVFDVKVKLKNLFEKTTLEEQAELILQADESSFSIIPVVEEQTDYPLSFAQERMWVLSQFEEASIAYNMPSVHVFEGSLNRENLSLSFEKLLARHESLRTVFKENERGEIRQFIMPVEEYGFEIDFHDLRSDNRKESHLNALVQQASHQAFDLSKMPLLRAGLYQLTDSKWIFVYTMHHIISDGWSMGILIKELLKFYSEYESGENTVLDPLRIQYKDYAEWQQQEFTRKGLESHKAYWMDQMEGELPVLELPTDKVRPSIKTYNGGAVERRIDPSLTKKLNSLMKEEEGTLFMGLTSLVNILLYKYTDQEDIILGTPVAGRAHADLEEQIGFYLNTLVLRTQFKGTESFKELLAKVKEISLGAYSHQSYPFDLLVEDLSPERNLSRSTLFDVMVILQNNENTKLDRVGEHLKVSPYEEEQAYSSKFDLLFSFVEDKDEEGIGMSIVYNSDLFHAGTIEQMASHVEQLLEVIIAAPEKAIAGLNYLHEQEEQKLLKVFNDTSAEYPRDETLNVLFEKQVDKSPEKVALVFQEKEFTYQAINEKSNQLAGFLRTKYTISPDSLIGIQLDRSEWMIISILAVLKAGAAYVPIDPDYPQERLDYILEDSQAEALIDSREIELFLEAAANYSLTNLEPLNKARDLAYVIYTSGSTGKPKGCMLEHQGVVNRIDWMWNEYEYSAEDTILQKTTFTFDVSVWEIFMPLCWGTKMVLCDKADIAEPERILSLIEKHKVSCLHFVPSMLNAFIASLFNQPEIETQLNSLRLVITSGEALPLATIRNWYNKVDVPIHNLYGPTETSVDVTYYATSAQDTNIPIGKPIWNTEIYILNTSDHLQPVGLVGEICIVGDGLARGYLNKPELTAEKFVTNPFNADQGMYRTGDLGKWLPDGNVEFIGRKDNQVKIRGYRIELGEIDHAIQNYPGINAVVVSAENDTEGDKHLIAYIVSEDSLNSDDLQAYLSSKLPHYMIPAYFVQIAEMPLTSSGKADRKKLKEFNHLKLTSTVEYVAAGNEVEEALVVMWEEILDQQEVSIKHNFFSIGGHSLKAIRLISMINKTFEVKITLKDLFMNPVLEHLAQFIQQSKKVKYVDIAPVPVQESYSLSSFQRRLWYLNQSEAAQSVYNMPGVFAFEGDLDKEKLNTALGIIIERHENLRTVFKEDDRGEVRQFVDDSEASKFKIDYRDLRTGKKEAINDLVTSVLLKPFDLSSGALLRVSLFQVEKDKHLLCYVMHHIISDGWSMRVLMNELVTIYNGLQQEEKYTLPPLNIQYKDYVAWLNTQLTGDNLKLHETYWLEQFADEIPVLKLPTDKLRPSKKTYEGGALSFTIDEKTTEDFKSLCSNEGNTLYTGLLTLVNVLLYKYTGQEDIVIGSPAAGREHVDIENQIGLFINTLPLRTKFIASERFKTLLEKTQKTTLEAYEHQVYPFDELVSKLKIGQTGHRNPLFDVWLVLHDNEQSEILDGLSLKGLKITEYEEAGIESSQFDLVFNFTEVEGKIETRIEYCSDIFVPETISRIADNFKHIITEVILDPDQSIDAIQGLNTDERKKILTEFNDSTGAYSEGNDLINIFEEQVKKTPEQNAIVCGEVSYTYQALSDITNQFGNYLRKKYGIKPDDLIGIQMERSEWALIAILGVLKSGGAYVPIDPDYPEERIDFILEDSNCKLVIDKSEIDSFRMMAKLYGKTYDDSVIQSNNLAYIIYTSGSTGQPKGVMVEHGAVTNTILSQSKIFDLKSREHGLQFASISFDASVSEIFTVISTGGVLYIAPDDVKKDPELLEEFINEHEIGFATIPPSYFKLLDKQNIKPLKKLITAGEAAITDDVLVYSEHGTCFNAYGPTETSICATVFKVDKTDGKDLSSIPIGKPIDNAYIYILDNNMNFAPIGAVGEVYIGGSGLARGYLNNATLTSERFIADPFNKEKRIYKTGDLGKWLPDGNVVYIGRNDEQVKIRGYRIELGEIENVLKRHSAIDNATVLVDKDKGEDKKLVAYIIANENLTIEDIQIYLLDSMPAYMLPAEFVMLAAFPLTVNGKIDKKLLLKETRKLLSANTEYVAARDEVEAKLVEMWEDILGREKIGVQDNFFRVGGHSLKATHLIAQIRAEYNVKINLSTLFEKPTIESIGQEIKRSQLVNAEDVKIEDEESISI